MNTNEPNEEQNKPIRLPLWRRCLEDMIKNGIEPEKIYPAEYFEHHLKLKSGDMKFGLALSEIRKAIEERGFYLSGRGFNGRQWQILPPRANKDIMNSNMGNVRKLFVRTINLGENTPRNFLTSDEQRLHDGELERAQIRFILFCRPKTVLNDMTREGKRKLLGNGSGE